MEWGAFALQLEELPGDLWYDGILGHYAFMILGILYPGKTQEEQKTSGSDGGSVEWMKSIQIWSQQQSQTSFCHD